MNTKLLERQEIESIVNRSDSALKTMSGKKIALFGSAGFLGRYYFEILNEVAEKFKITLVGFDNGITAGALGEKQSALAHGYFSFHQLDLIHDEIFELVSDCDYLVHGAGIASPYHYNKFPLETFDVSIIGVRKILEVAKRTGARVTFFSSSEIYGDPIASEVPIRECYRGNVNTIGPRACYDESKRGGETLCHIYHEYYGVHTNIVRPFNVYGPGMQRNDYRVMPNFAAALLDGKPLKVYGSGLQTRTFTYIEDAMVGFLATIANGAMGHPYNIGNPQGEMSIVELAQIFCEVGAEMGCHPNVSTVQYPDSYPADEPMRRCPDITKAREHLGFDPIVSTRDGVGRFLRWASTEYNS